MSILVVDNAGKRYNARVIVWAGEVSRVRDAGIVLDGIDTTGAAPRTQWADVSRTNDRTLTHEFTNQRTVTYAATTTRTVTGENPSITKDRSVTRQVTAVSGTVTQYKPVTVHAWDRTLTASSIHTVTEDEASRTVTAEAEILNTRTVTREVTNTQTVTAESDTVHTVTGMPRECCLEDAWDSFNFFWCANCPGWCNLGGGGAETVDLPCDDSDHGGDCELYISGNCSYLRTDIGAACCTTCGHAGDLYVFTGDNCST